MPARTGFESTYPMQAVNAASSSSVWDLKRPSHKLQEQFAQLCCPKGEYYEWYK